MYQAWALQWTLFQQAQQAAAYQNQLYQSFTNQQKPSPNPVPPPPPPNNYNSQQQNNNMNTTQSKWQPSRKIFKN
jgi:hypothetical protein